METYLGCTGGYNVMFRVYWRVQRDGVRMFKVYWRVYNGYMFRVPCFECTGGYSGNMYRAYWRVQWKHVLGVLEVTMSFLEFNVGYNEIMFRVYWRVQCNHI